MNPYEEKLQEAKRMAALAVDRARYFRDLATLTTGFWRRFMAHRRAESAEVEAAVYQDELARTQERHDAWERVGARARGA